MRTTLVLLATTALIGLPACDDEESGDTGHTSHGSTGHHETGGHADAEVMWMEPPPATATADAPIDASFMVHTEGEIHVTELRACMGADVHECGLGGMDSFDENVAAPADGDHYAGSLTLPAGTWSVVAYAHVGPDPFISEHVNVTVE